RRPVIEIREHRIFSGHIITGMHSALQRGRVNERLKCRAYLPPRGFANMIVLKVIMIDSAHPCEDATVTRIHRQESGVEETEVMFNRVDGTKIHLAIAIPGEH